jgi:AGZA family xanthine/uracil permease-like MFS transporter
MTWSIRKLNDRVARSSFGRYFLLEGSGHPKERKGARLTTEIRGGLTTFSSMV